MKATINLKCGETINLVLNDIVYTPSLVWFYCENGAIVLYNVEQIQALIIKK